MPHPLESDTLRILNVKGQSVGTGFLVSKDIIVTCAHVVVAAGRAVQVQFTGRDELLSAQIIPEYWRDPNNGDIAFLRLEGIPKNFTPLRLGAAEYSQSGNPFHTFGYPNVGDVEGIHAGSEILGVVTENKRPLLQLRSMELNQGHSGAPVWDEKRKVVVGMVVSVYKSDASGKLRDTAFAIPSEVLWQVCPEICPSDTPPYLGLEAFTDETTQFFFGREMLIEKLLGILHGGCRFLAVFGPSGSGKSSVVRAGLLPALKRGQLPGSQKWAQITMRPADNPFEQMKTAGLDLIDVNSYLKSHADMERAVLFIDQFEELFTLCPDNIRDRFVRDLADALENSKLILVLSMRNDFYSVFNAKATSLAESEHLKIENVPEMLKRDELIAMIEQPADAAGFVLEEGLTELILKDVAIHGEARSAMLPLLEFTLTQLWGKRQDGRLTHEAYQSIGGVTGSLALWADDAYSDLPKVDHPLAESLLTSLVHLGDESQGLPDTRRRRTLTELETVNSARRVIKHFTDRRLIFTSGEMVELVHDSLVREWGRLQSWVKNDRDNLRLKEGVSDAAKAWRTDTTNAELLIHRGGRLDDALKLRSKMNAQEQAYLYACKEAIQRRKRFVFASTSFAIFTIITVLAGWGFTSNENSKQLAYQVNTAEAAKAMAVGEANTRATAQIQAELQRNSVLALQLAAQSQLLNIDIGTSNIQTGLLAIEAAKLGAGLPADQALRRYLNNTALPIANMLHDDDVITVAISSNSQYVVSGSIDNTVRVWDAMGKEIARMYHDDRVNIVSFSPDGKYIISGSQDNSIRVWSTTSGQEIDRMLHDSWVTSIAISPDGKYIASGSWDNTVRIWNLKGGIEVMRFENDDWVTSVAFCQNGRFVVSGSQDGTARVWDITVGKEIARMTHNSRVTSVAFSPDCKYIVSGGFDKTARVWEAENGKEISRTTHGSWVIGVDFSPDGKFVVSGGTDSTARVWEAGSGLEISRMVLDSWITSVVFSPNGKYVISGSSVGMVRIWDAHSGLEIAHTAHDEVVYSFAVSPNGKFFVSGSNDHAVRIWGISSGSEISSMNHQRLITSIDFSPDGKYIATSSQDHTARVWDVFSGNEVSFVIHGNNVNSVSFSPDGKFVVSSSQDGIAHIWEAVTGRKICKLEHGEGVTIALFSPDANYVVTGSEYGTIRIWEVANCHNTVLMAHNYAITSLAYSPDGEYIVSGSLDYTARVWDTKGGQEIVKISHDEQVSTVVFSPNGRYILTGSNDNTARVSLATTGQEIAYVAHAGGITSIAISPDGWYIASGSNDGKIKIWETITGKEIARMSHDSVNSVAFSPDGKYIVSGGLDKTIRVWKTNNGHEEARIPQDDGIISVVFSPNGEYIASGNGIGGVRIIYPFTDQLITEACRRIPRNFTRAEWLQYIGDIFPYQVICPDLSTEPLNP